jgi:hypothetical protein
LAGIKSERRAIIISKTAHDKSLFVRKKSSQKAKINLDRKDKLFIFAVPKMRGRKSGERKEFIEGNDKKR